MHQTFYIDIDEEITSIVDRLRRSKAKEAVVVVPKRALLIQSIVNLKLLKKEADRLKKHVIIVTQDKMGKLLVEKAGIAIEQKLDDIESEEMVPEEKKVTGEGLSAQLKRIEEGETENVASKLDNIGSADYFDGPIEEKNILVSVAPEVKGVADEEKTEKAEESVPDEKIINRELVSEAGVSLQEKRTFFKKKGPLDMVRNISIRQVGEAEQTDDDQEKEADKDKNAETKSQNYTRERIQKKEPAVQAKTAKSTDSIDTFFINRKPAESGRPKIDFHNEVNISGKFRKVLLTFGALAVVFASLVVAYLFLPKTTIKIFPKHKSQMIDAVITGSTAAAATDLGNKVIPAKIITVEDSFSGSFDSSGNKSATSQKAHGTLTIYNEYSTSSQPLVATTRFLSTDGKLFRLIKGVAVPGLSNVGGNIQPGAIEAEVVADQPGSAFNVGPTDFTIPGFQSSGQKYTKFYAKSFKAMTGGGEGTETVKTVTAADLSAAKNKVTADLTNALGQKIKDNAGAGNVVMDDAISFGEASYTLSNSEGEAVDQFTAGVKMQATVVVFNENDLKSVVGQLLDKAGDGKTKIDKSSLTLQYGKADVDFTKGTILIRVNVSGKIEPDIDLVSLKQNILGKNEDEFRASLKAYPDIDRAEISYWPTFLTGHISAFPSRVDVELDNN